MRSPSLLTTLSALLAAPLLASHAAALPYPASPGADAAADLIIRAAQSLPTTDAPFSVPAANVSNAIQCTSPPDGSKRVVLLVHGTALNAASWQSGPYWNLLPKQSNVISCTVNLPHRALGDAQISGEYVAQAIISLAKKSSDGKVAVVGHSQGGGLNIPWATIFWPSARKAVSTFVGLAPDFHGTIVLPAGACVAQNVLSGFQGCSAAFLQQDASSKYLKAQEAFLQSAIVPTSAVFTRTDEIVIPQFPQAVASSRLPGSVQFPLQDFNVCGPLHLADHLDMTIDPAAFSIVKMALASSTGLPDKAKFDKSSCYNFANTDLNFSDAKPTFEYLTGLGLAVAFSDGVYAKTEPPLASYVPKSAYS